ncbi:hypothetical protein HG537_0H01670 [Torulaspora globosa]|uniref:RWD domain-containing protein n=1 Tax=Torulaspora globosa TaxID=48254 RepID=A0A7H9I0K5_9SACH|nr:hypothetical protein HG537_0H01670 [Torulaspora sp. CBS 2947]
MAGHVGEDPYESPTFGKALSLRVDGDVNAISINPSGRDVVLASRQGLHIIDLDDPFSPPRWLRHVTPWQVADVQWCPHPAKPHWVISTSNQKAIIWNLARSSSDAIEHVLHKHFRAITDINFNSQRPDILATCSVDTYVHAWDMRSPSRPFYTTRDWFAGASQVKWSFQDQNVLASAHANDISIWDLRKGSTPLAKLVGHKSGVNSVDFNRFKSHEIMTASNDGTVKFWDYSTSGSELKKTIRADFPVWRGRYLPFGEGCCLLPTIGGGNSIYLASLKDQTASDNDSKLQPIYAFKGHSDRVIDFLWRSRYPTDALLDEREFQLVTWSKDCDLRLWPVQEMIYDKVNFERGRRLEKTLHSYEYVTYNREHDEQHFELGNNNRRRKEIFVTTSGLSKKDDMNYITWLSGVRMNHTASTDNIFSERTIQNLGEEVSSIGHKFPKIVFEKISVSTGELILNLNGPWSETNPEEYVFLRVEVSVPRNYPSKGCAPSFKIEDSGSLSSEQAQKIGGKLKEIAKKYTDSGLYCLEPCLRHLLGESINLDDLSQEVEPLLNFEITDHIGFDNLSSVPSSDDSSQIFTDASSDSESDHIKDVLTTSDNQPFRASDKRDLSFDSTPVPNECGAVWSATGQLLCFFASESQQEKKQQAMLRLGGKEHSRQPRHFKTDFQLRGSHEIPADNRAIEKTARPKRYIQTITGFSNAPRSVNYSSDDQSSEGYSSDDFDDDWCDVLRNEMVVRTKLPALHGKFSKPFGSMHSDSAKTLDSSKKLKNIIFFKDFQHLIADRRELALEYQLTDSNLEKITRNNALVAEKYNMEEISHCWQVLSDMVMKKDEDDPYDLVWDNHPMGIKWFIKEAIKYFEQKNNLQMLAMLCCIVANQFSPKQSKNRTDHETVIEKKKVESLVTFCTGGDAVGSFRTDLHSHYSSSLASSSLEALNRVKHSPDDVSVKSEDYFSMRHHSCNGQPSGTTPPLPGRNHRTQAQTPDVHVQLLYDDVLESIENPNRNLMDPPEARKLTSYSYQYAKLLSRWMLPIERVEMIKISFDAKKDSTDYEPQIADENRDLYGGIVTTWRPNDPKKRLFQNCNYCGLKVTRSIFVCQNCEHIMHSACATEWWQSSQECASGCRCRCPEAFPCG